MEKILKVIEEKREIMEVDNMKVAVTWEMCGYVDVPEAKTVEDAMKIFKEKSDYIKLPDGEYVDGSFQLTTEDLEEMEIMVN